MFTEKMSTKKTYRYYLKARIELKYPDKILFISPGYRIQEVVISSHCLETKTIAESIQYAPKKFVIQKAAEIWREYIRSLISLHSTVSWLPKVKELQCNQKKSPDVLRYFKETLLLSKSKSEIYPRFCEISQSTFFWATASVICII